MPLFGKIRTPFEKTRTPFSQKVALFRQKRPRRLFQLIVLHKYAYSCINIHLEQIENFSICSKRVHEPTTDVLPKMLPRKGGRQQRPVVPRLSFGSGSWDYGATSNRQYISDLARPVVPVAPSPLARVITRACASPFHKIQMNAELFCELSILHETLIVPNCTCCCRCSCRRCRCAFCPSRRCPTRPW